MKHILAEICAWLPAFSVVLTIEPEQLFMGMATLLLLFFKGMIATLSSMVGRWIFTGVYDWYHTRSARRINRKKRQ